MILDELTKGLITCIKIAITSMIILANLHEGVLINIALYYKDKLFLVLY